MRPGTCGQQRCSHSNGSQGKGTLVQHLLTHNILTHRCRVIRLIFYFLYQFVFLDARDKFRPTQRCPRVRRMRPGTCRQQRRSHSNGSQGEGALAHLLLDRNLLTHYLGDYESPSIFCTFFGMHVTNSVQRARIKGNTFNEVELGGVSIEGLPNL